MALLSCQGAILPGAAGGRAWSRAKAGVQSQEIGAGEQVLPPFFLVSRGSDSGLHVARCRCILGVIHSPHAASSRNQALRTGSCLPAGKAED